MEKNLKKYIIFLIIIIIIILVFILLFYKKSEKESINNENNAIDGKSFDIKEETNLVNVVSNNEFYNIRNCVQYYIDYINDKNFTALLTVLDYNYVKKNNITIESLQQNFQQYNGNKFIANNMNKREITLDFITYYVDGYIVDENYSKFEEIEFTVLVDNAKELFSIIPEVIYEGDNYNINLESDNDNYYNKILYKTFSNADIISEYFNLYKDLALKNPEVAYSLLDNEYREKRFANSTENYIKFLEDINIKDIYLSKYAFYIYEDYKEYVGIDKSGLYYIFKETNPMGFKIILDTYTIETDKFRDTYNSSDEQDKVMMNVDKFITMLNNRDYTAAYSVLDDTFKNNNFGSEDAFEEYIKNKCPLHYEVEYSSFEKRGSDLFVQNIVLKDITGIDTGAINLSIIMKLEEGTNFVMSFSM